MAAAELILEPPIDPLGPRAHDVTTLLGKDETERAPRLLLLLQRLLHFDRAAGVHVDDRLVAQQDAVRPDFDGIIGRVHKVIEVLDPPGRQGPQRNRHLGVMRRRRRHDAADGDPALGLAACQKGLSVRFATASHLVHELIEARDEKRLLRLQAQLARVNLLIVDELGYVPLSQTGSELLFDVFSRRYENGATIVTSNLPFQEWTTVFASERLTGALLDRITHHVHILEMNGESYRLKQSRSRRRRPSE